ncbi:methyltransferase type 11 [Iodidimonas muriae]|uniref:Methyltransferase type 11 n=1 Tax=Iodidimonas muriae TaxID=261467 RepID=A0ABQ2LCZ7_9PROT|nr:class I SAM-dependent methyltransferase [Iodidimonas muriae]GER07307.1 methyltransferase type 11 [Kordiimonadales bacterium JCM 17843]GGO11036.1 methyltransferase type 11 [Iodidimonas muriae]
MRPDVIALRNFYDRPLGRATADILSQKIIGLWPDLSGQHVAGIGYTPPFLDRLLQQSVAQGQSGPASLVALMPAAQGVVHWPGPRRNATALVDEQDLPLPDGAFDRVILVHALEVADPLRDLLREVWRILSPGGRMIAIVPRRRGLWSGFEQTPYGSGQPYSSQQLEATLANHLLPVCALQRALFLPPILPFSRGRGLALMERPGGVLMQGLAGVLMVEAEKQIYRAVPSSTATREPFKSRASRPHLVPPMASRTDGQSTLKPADRALVRKP